MKVLVVFALAVFTGCNADLMGMRVPPQQQLSMAKDAFWDYVSKATMTAEESVKQIRSSELGRDIDTLITESTEAVDRLTSSLRTQMAPVNQELIEQLSERAEVLKLQLQRVLSAVSSGLQPYTEELVDDLRRRVEELRREAAPYTGTVDTQALRTTLLRTSQELRAQLERSSQELQAHMGPLSQELRQTVEQLQSRVMPLAQSLQEQMSQRSQEVQQRLEPYTEELRAKVDAEAQNVRRQLEALWDSFVRTRQ